MTGAELIGWNECMENSSGDVISTVSLTKEERLKDELRPLLVEREDEGVLCVEIPEPGEFLGICNETERLVF
jgi:hypothetical protein